jgi:hypothetical protein
VACIERSVENLGGLEVPVIGEAGRQPKGRVGKPKTTGSQISS